MTDCHEMKMVRRDAAKANWGSSNGETIVMRLKREFRAMPIRDKKSGKVESYTCMACVYDLGDTNRRKWPTWPTEAEVEMHIASDHDKKIQ